jgi:hypothetical protein
VQGFYSGTSVAIPNPTGIFSRSATNANVLAIAANGTATVNLVVNPPAGNSGGTVLFEWTVLPGGGAGCEIEVSPTSVLTAFDVISFRFPISLTTLDTQTFFVPNLGVDALRFVKSCATNPAANPGRFNLFFLTGDTVAPQGRSLTFPAQTATGVTAGVALPFGMHSFDGAGAVEPYNTTPTTMPTIHTFQLNVTGAPTSCTYQVEGSLDSQGAATGTFFDATGPLNCTVNTIVHISGRPLAMIRGNLTALAGGAAPTVTMRYLGTR